LPELRRILLTGGNSGIGFEAAVLLCRAGHPLTLLCRDGTSAEEASHRVAEKAGSTTLPQSAICDLGDLESVRACAAALLAAGTVSDTLVLNAGLQYAGAKEPRRTPQGFELSVGVNHLGHLLLPSCSPPRWRPDARLAWWSPLRKCMTPPAPAARWAGQPGWVISAA